MSQNNIGTLKEKSTHAMLKKFLEPNDKYHEVPLFGYICDIFDGNQIYEIQTSSFFRLKDKLKIFLKKYKVTVVYPIFESKEIIWIDKFSGEIRQTSKSGMKKAKYKLFEELYSIRDFLTDKNFNLKVIMIKGREYKYLDGKGKYSKAHATKIDKVPSEIIGIFDYHNKFDYCEFIPFNQNEAFTKKDFLLKTGYNSNTANMMLKIFLDNLFLIEKIGKRGKAFLYQVSARENDYFEYDNAVVY